MYNIIPLILILVSFIVIIFIVVKKFPMLANLDFENIPEEKEAKFKEQIISNRLKRIFSDWSGGVIRLWKPAGKHIGGFFQSLHDRLVKFKESHKKEPIISDLDSGERMEKLFAEAESLIRKEEIDQAEKLLIEIIGIDNKNIKAFKLLGDLYFFKKNYEEAKQTFEYILKFKENGEVCRSEEADHAGSAPETYFDLATVYKALGDADKAASNIEKALDIEPNNPRYLDTMFEISIIKKDKMMAQESYERLASANPENQKLEDLKRQVDDLV